MPVDERYRRQVALLMQIIPLITPETCFALKGGTAINLFIRDMPRLSVDIDLTYIPIADRTTSLNEIDAAMRRIKARIIDGIAGARVTAGRLIEQNCTYKLFPASAMYRSRSKQRPYCVATCMNQRAGVSWSALRPHLDSRIFELYLQRYAKPNTRYWPVTEGLFKRDVLPLCGHRQITSIKRYDVSELLHGIMERGSPYAAIQVHSSIRTFWNWSVERGYAEVSPLFGMRPPAKSLPRETQTSGPFISGHPLACCLRFWHGSYCARSQCRSGQWPCSF
jgi:nucleotidyltransferase AbiEii toxin of type IV toxin-antitoxin system/integrase-like protein